MKVCVRCSEVYEDTLERCPADGELLVSASDPLIGRTVGGRYRLISRIGVGGMSTVYLARHVLIDRLVAVKVLRRDLAQDPRQRDRFIREARAVNRINHENIVEITDFGETEDGLVYLVMEYVPGEPLFKAMSAGPFSALRSLNIAEQIAGALGRAHQMGVVHRDLKPENLLVVPRKGRIDFIKILDFGIAKILDAPSLTGSQQIFGTPGYIAPEYIESANIDGRADLYSLGVILYELVTGALPFDYEYPGDLLVKHVTEAPIPPRRRRPEVEVPVESLILRCLEKKPERRFRDAYHFLDELRSARERLGGDESWGGLADSPEARVEHARKNAPTPVIAPGSQDDLLRRTFPEVLSFGDGPPLGDTYREPSEPGIEHTGRRSDAPKIPPPPPPGRAGIQPPLREPAASRTSPTPPDGLAGSRRWRRRFDAIRSAL
ncbi:MAG: serine/threonine protein kinase, partial [Polyangiaceae bacterium]|nr:serine/threonine protein kinase [Polyangiaceae bacterium]